MQSASENRVRQVLVFEDTEQFLLQKKMGSGVASCIIWMAQNTDILLSGDYLYATGEYLFSYFSGSSRGFNSLLAMGMSIYHPRTNNEYYFEDIVSIQKSRRGLLLAKDKDNNIRPLANVIVDYFKPKKSYTSRGSFFT